MRKTLTTSVLLAGIAANAGTAAVAGPLDTPTARSSVMDERAAGATSPTASNADPNASEMLDAAEASAPTAPTGLEARVYSRTAGEIFWTRPATFGLVYDVTRDGRKLATTDGTSYFDDTLAAGRSYAYRIVAIDRQGRRSAASSVTLTTLGGTAAGLAAPSGLEVRAYSGTAGEIFWARPATFGLVYDVTRDGRELATTDGTSYFDDTLAAGRSYTYGIVAIDRAGRRSAPARIALTTLGSAASTSMISRESYEGLVAHAFELYVGDRYNAPLLPLTGPYDEVVSVAPSYGPVLEDDGVVRARYGCESGRAALDLNPTNGNAGVFLRFRFEQCLDRGLLRDGTIDANSGGPASWIRSEGLRLETDSARVLRFSGYARRGYSASRAYLRPTWETIGTNLVGRDGDGEFALRESSTSFAFAFGPGFDSASLSGGFSIRSAATGGQELFVGTPTEFSYFWDYREPPESSGGQVPRNDPTAPWSRSDASEERRDDWYFASGQLELVGEDGSRLSLDADTGDATTVRITIDDAAGSDVFETSWAPWQRLLRFALYAGGAGG